MTATKKQPKKAAKKTSAKSKTTKVAKKTVTEKIAAKSTTKPARQSARPTRAHPTKAAPTHPGDSIAVDGTRLSELLDLAGAPPSADPSVLTTLEKQLGRPVPGELRTYLARRPALDNPPAGHPTIADPSFAGALPDVPAWLAQLIKPFEGPRQAVHQLAGLYPLAMKLDHGDYLQFFAGLDSYGELDTGGVFYFDDNEIGGSGPGTLSGFLRRELQAHFEAVEQAEGGTPRDCLRFTGSDPPHEPPAATELPVAITAAFKRRAKSMTARWHRILTLLQLLRGKPPHLAGLPDEALWHAERPTLASDHANAMYWLLAHWLFDNEPELAEAITLTATHPSPLVAALRDHVASHDTAAYAPQRVALFAAVRAASR